MSCPHSSRVGTTIAVLPGCSHYYLQVIMTSFHRPTFHLVWDLGENANLEPTRIKPRNFCKKKCTWYFFLKLDRKAAPTSAGKRHFLMKSRIDKKIISTPCSFSPHWTISVPSRRNQTITCDEDETKPFSPKPRRFGVGKLAFWAFQLCNWQKPIPSTLAPPISLDSKISPLSALVPWWSPGPNRRRSELLLQSKATRSPGHRRPSRYQAFGRDEALGDLFFRKLSPGWLVISHIFASCMCRCV